MNRKQKMWLAMGFAAAMAVAGISPSDVADYAQIFQQHVAASVHEATPVDVELRRLLLIQSRLDQQLVEKQSELARAQVALEDSEVALRRDRIAAEQSLIAIKALRSVLNDDCRPIRIGCRTYSPGTIRHALQHQLAVNEAITTAITARESAVAQQREAYNAFAERYAASMQQRDLLGHRVEALRSRHAAQQTADGSLMEFDSADLTRASQLADAIERKLRIAEKQQELASSLVRQPIQPSAAEESVESRIDRMPNRFAR